MQIRIRIKKGPPSGKPAWWADANADDKIEIKDFPVWQSAAKNGRPASYQVGIPTRTTKDGNRVDTVKLSPSTFAEIAEAILAEIDRISEQIPADHQISRS